LKTTPYQSVTPIDANHLLYGNFIGLQYVFETPLNIRRLEQSISALARQFPALSSRYNAKLSRVDFSDDAPVLKRKRSTKTLAEALESNTRPNFVEEPNRRDVLKGRSPLSTFTATEFSDGGMIIGVAVSHLLTDAAGYHLILQQLSKIYTAINLDKPVPNFPHETSLGVFNFGTQTSKQEVLTVLKQRGLPKPMSIKGLRGAVIRSLIIRYMDRSLQDNRPIKIEFSSDDLIRLKNTVLIESGEDWISTNMALCAHLTSIIAKLSYPDKIKHEMQIGQLLNLRGRYFEADAKAQANYIGNAILIHIDKVKFKDGLQKTSRGRLAQYFKQRQSNITSESIQNRLNLLADCLSHGFTNPELDIKNPIISLNNQSKMPVYALAFDGLRPIQIIPQDVGDNIMIFPLATGGVEIYIRDIVNPRKQQELFMPRG